MRFQEDKISYRLTFGLCQKSKREIIFIKIENNAIHYETIIEKLPIIQHLSNILHREYVVLSKAFDYWTNNILKAIKEIKSTDSSFV